MGVLRRETLLLALERIYGKKGLSKGEVESFCDFILSFFGYEDYVLDNVLSSQERDAFYDLEENGILKTEREEITLPKGKIWRINQWTYIMDNIIGDKDSMEEGKTDIEKEYEEIFRQIEKEKANNI
ncbi:DUF6015 family protein [Caldiplasma sukawensis]